MVKVFGRFVSGYLRTIVGKQSRYQHKLQLPGVLLLHVLVQCFDVWCMGIARRAGSEEKFYHQQFALIDVISVQMVGMPIRIGSRKIRRRQSECLKKYPETKPEVADFSYCPRYFTSKLVLFQIN